MKRFGLGYIKSVIEEARKVVWPTREIVMRHTIMVVIAVAIAVLVFASYDYLMQKLVITAIK